MKTLRILVANDYKVVRDGLRELLQNPNFDGWEVCGRAWDGSEVAEKVARLNPDVIVADLGVPLLEGNSATPNAGVVPERTTRDRLTRREREVVQLVSEGKTTKEVACVLGISVKTAETHRSNVMRKLDLHSVTQLVMYAVYNKIVPVWQPAASMST